MSSETLTFSLLAATVTLVLMAVAASRRSARLAPATVRARKRSR
ncbi:hypothetical protein [Rhodobacter sp. NSM]